MGERYEVSVEGATSPKPESPRRRRSSAPAFTGFSLLERAATVGVSPHKPGDESGATFAEGAEGMGPSVEKAAVKEIEDHLKRREWFVHVGGATNLPSTDWNARSDPYCKVLLDGNLVGKTRKLKGTCHPCWAQAFPLGELTAATRLTLTVWDADTMGSDDLLGSVTLSGQDIWAAREEVLNLALLNGKGEKQSTKSGETHLGVAIVEARHLPRCDSYWKLRKPIMQAAGVTSGTINRPWFVVTPGDLASSGWDVLLSIAMMYNAIITPFEICVTRYHERPVGELHALPVALNAAAWCVYVIFLVDTAIQFILAYFEDTVRMWVFEPQYIIERYLKSHLLIDLMSILPHARRGPRRDRVMWSRGHRASCRRESLPPSGGPLAWRCSLRCHSSLVLGRSDRDRVPRLSSFVRLQSLDPSRCGRPRWRLICAFLGSSSGGMGGRVRRYVRALRLIELLRCTRTPRLIKRLRERGSADSSGGVRTCGAWGSTMSTLFSWILTHGIGRMRHSSLTLLKFCVISLISLHWVACVWALLPTLQAESMGWTDLDGRQNTLAGRGDRPMALYVQSFEFAITTMVMDQARSQPSNTFEQAVWLVVALIMGAMYAYIIGMICSVVTTMDPATTEFNATADLLDTYMKELGLDNETSDQARRYFEHTELHFRQNYYRRLLEMLSPELRGVFAQQMCGVWVHSIWFFNCNDINERARFVTAVALALRVAAYNRQEYIVRVGERADAMYIVRRGIVGVRGVPFSCGRFFGEEMIRDGQWRDYSAICATFTDLHVLLAVDLRAILAESRFPRTRKMIRLRVIYMTFQRHIKLVVKAYRMRLGYRRMTPEERAKYTARVKEFAALSIPPKVGSSKVLGSPDKLATAYDPVAYSEADRDAEAQRRMRFLPPERPLDMPKLAQIKVLHSEGSETFREELKQTHGLDTRDLTATERRAQNDMFQSVCEEPGPAAPGVTKADLAAALKNMEQHLLKCIAAGPRSPSPTPGGSARNTPPASGSSSPSRSFRPVNPASPQPDVIHEAEALEQLDARIEATQDDLARTQKELASLKRQRTLLCAIAPDSDA